MRLTIICLFISIIISSGCSTKYDTIANKDVSVRVRSIWADVDYDSRVCESTKPLEALPELKESTLEPLRRK